MHYPMLMSIQEEFHVWGLARLHEQFCLLSLPMLCVWMLTHVSSCAGEIKVTDVMFPNGSPNLVEPIFKNPLLSAPFNEQLAAVIRVLCPRQAPGNSSPETRQSDAEAGCYSPHAAHLCTAL